MDVLLRMPGECPASDRQRGDVTMVDNVLSTHGREPFTGARRILVAMAVSRVGA